MPRSTSDIATTAWLTDAARRRGAAAGGPRHRHHLARRCRPLARDHPCHRKVAAGPPTSRSYRDRGDEIGALARSIAVFQDAMHQNVRAQPHRDRRRRSARAAVRSRWRPKSCMFSADVEATLAELGRISEQMLAASRAFVERGRRGRQAHRAGATTASSSEASANVRDIAAAADELAASVPRSIARSRNRTRSPPRPRARPSRPISP